MTQKKKKKKANNPFKRAWRQINSFFGAIGLLSITKDYLQLQPFLEELIDFYQSIVIIPWKLIPFEVWDWLKHYLFFGILWVTSSTKAASVAYKEEIEEGKNIPSTETKFSWKFLSFVIAINLGFLIIWPFYVIWHLLQIVKKKKEPISKLTFQWFGSILIYFIFLFILNRMLGLF